MVHEWGTFTALQDEGGRPIGGINTDDEPLPNFVHDLRSLVARPTEAPSVLFKGVPRCDRDILVRLETPVIYFHLPAGAKPIRLNLDVTFHGGWLTQYYPDAKATAPGSNRTPTTSALSRKKPKALSPGRICPSETKRPDRDHRCTRLARAPRGACRRRRHRQRDRAVSLLPRRRAHRAPVAVARTTMNDLRISTSLQQPVQGVWLLDVRPDGTSALRDLGQTLSQESSIITPAAFRANDYRPENIQLIRGQLRNAIVKQGLYDDEAEALLNTWEVSYFRRPGMRLFFMVPAEWTNRVLPLHLSVPSDVVRTMIGRIEIVTPQERSLLARISAGPISAPAQWLNASLQKAAGGENYYREEWYMKLLNGESTFQNLRLDVPADYRAYLQLGRFRNALALDEQKLRPSDNLARFIQNYQLAPSRW